MSDYEKERAEKARRTRILCQWCSTATRQIFHSWKRSEGNEFRPAEEPSNTER